MQIIDIYTHTFTEAFFSEFERAAPALGNMGKRVRTVRPLFDLDIRFREMDQVGDGYQQVISLANPAIEDVVKGSAANDVAKAGNDELAELCRKHPDRFLGFAAALNMQDIDNAVREAERAIDDLGARGLQIFTNVAGHPLDDPKYRPVFDAAAKRDVPIWLHPARTAAMVDYAKEQVSRYEVWWSLGWPYETSVAMIRLVLSGLFDRHPSIRIITHHCGGMIPYFDGRIDFAFATLGTRTTAEDHSKVVSSLAHRPLDALKCFYGDTAMLGGRNWLQCGLSFFGVDHIVFASDSPFGRIDEAIEVIRQSSLSVADQEKVLSGNARKLLKI